MNQEVARRQLLRFVVAGTMVGIYFKTDRLPVRFLLYVAMTAMTRFLAVDIKELPIQSVVVVTGSILVLAFAVLVLQIAASKFAMVAAEEEVRLQK
jgi:protein PsiE